MYKQNLWETSYFQVTAESDRERGGAAHHFFCTKDTLRIMQPLVKEVTAVKEQAKTPPVFSGYCLMLLEVHLSV